MPLYPVLQEVGAANVAQTERVVSYIETIGKKANRMFTTLHDLNAVCATLQEKLFMEAKEAWRYVSYLNKHILCNNEQIAG